MVRKMKISDYTSWIWNEILGSKTFTCINVLGVWLNVFILVIFLTLSTGIEKATINQITRNVDLFTIQVSSQNDNLSLSLDEFRSLENDQRVLQIVPVINHTMTLKLTNKEFSRTIAKADVYMESYFTESESGTDLRTSSLNIEDGKILSKNDKTGIIISSSIYKELFKQNRNSKNWKDWTLNLEIQRNSKVRIFKCKLIGIAKQTQYGGALIYVASPLSREIDAWWNSFDEAKSLDYKTYPYQRIDFVSKNLVDLADLRSYFRKINLQTTSVLDKVELLKTILLALKIFIFSIIGFSATTAISNIVITLSSYVLKRKREIGILKALGATNFQIQMIYIYHSMYITLLGSTFGIFSALLVINVVKALFLKASDRSATSIIMDILSIDFFQIGVVYMSAVFIGIFAAFLPARHATKIAPIQMLHHS